MAVPVTSQVIPFNKLDFIWDAETKQMSSFGDFPGGAQWLRSHLPGQGGGNTETVTPDQGTKIPCASTAKNTKQKQYFNKFNTGF